jgi:hypothetical protein
LELKNKDLDRLNVGNPKGGRRKEVEGEAEIKILEDEEEKEARREDASRNRGRRRGWGGNKGSLYGGRKEAGGRRKYSTKFFQVEFSLEERCACFIQKNRPKPNRSYFSWY